MAEELCRLGAASVQAEAEHRWTIGNDRIARTVEWAPGRGFAAASLTHRGSGHSWAAPEGAEFQVQWNAATLSGRDARGARGSARADDKAVELVVALDFDGGLQVEAHYRCTPGNAVLQQWIELRADTAGRLASTTMLLDAAHSGPATLRWVHGLGVDGAISETGEYISFRLRETALGAQELVSGTRSTQHHVPWLVLGGAEPGEGLFVGLQYSGQWAARAAHANGALTLALGPTGVAVDLAASERWVGPRSFTGAFSGTLDDAAAVQHRFYRTALSPALPADFPWIQYNTWFSYFCDFDATVLEREADLAAELGVELFYVDAGWWFGNPRRGSNFSSGLGNWRETREKFPSGLGAFADYVRKRGMRFGLWVEPERVDIRTAATGTWHPDWLTQQRGTYHRVHWPTDTETGWLCFGHAPTRAWAVEWIGQLVQELGLEWLKWDSNWWGVCDAEHHDHGAADGEYHQVAGVHLVLDELRRRFPELIIENCAGGGSRMDFAMAEHTHVAWVNDWSEPSHRVRFHLAGAGYPYPPEMLNTWVTESALDDLNERALPRPVLDAIFRSRMLGALGISCRIGEWPAETRAAMRDALVEYKRLRPILAAGQLRHLLPQPELRMPGLPTPAAWEAYQLYEPASKQGALLVFRGLAAAGAQTIFPQALDAAASYTLMPVDGAPTTRSGADLMARGIACELLPLTSALVFFAAATAEGAADDGAL